MPPSPQPAHLPRPLRAPTPAGSGRSFTAYVFNRADAPAPLPAGLAVEAALAEELDGEAQLATPAQSGEGELACPADSSSQQQAAATDLADSAARPAVGAGGGHAVAPAPQQQQQQPALGRGLRRATRSRKVAEASEAAAAADAATAAEAGAGAADRAEPKAGGRKAGTPQKPRGVQKKQSPAKTAPAQRGLLLPGAWGCMAAWDRVVATLLSGGLDRRGLLGAVLGPLCCRHY